MLLIYCWRLCGALSQRVSIHHGRTADQIHLACMIIFDEMKIMVGKLCRCSDGVKDVHRSGQIEMYSVGHNSAHFLYLTVFNSASVMLSVCLSRHLVAVQHLQQIRVGGVRPMEAPL